MRNEEFNTARRSKDETYNKSTANGSISNLINKTPYNDPIYKKHADKITAGSNIFVPDCRPAKRSKIGSQNGNNKSLIFSYSEEMVKPSSKENKYNLFLI